MLMLGFLRYEKIVNCFSVITLEKTKLIHFLNLFLLSMLIRPRNITKLIKYFSNVAHLLAAMKKAWFFSVFVMSWAGAFLISFSLGFYFQLGNSLHGQK